MRPQDAPYWNIYPERHGVVWVALEETTEANGTMSVLPGHHTRGCIPRFRDETRGNFVHNIRPEQLPPPAELRRRKVDYCFAPGTGAVHDIMMPHTSLPNRTRAARRAFNLRYCSAEGLLGASLYSHPLSGEATGREFILVCGEDTESRGFGRLPSWMQPPHSVEKYCGVPGVDASRHERPHGEPGSYPLTNLAPAPPRITKL